MNPELTTIVSSFTFCLAMVIAGVLLIFRFQKLKKLRGRGYLQGYVVLIYTFGFYSLWSQLILPRIPDTSRFTNIEFVGNTVFIMGMPFLLIGLIFLVAWAHQSQERSRFLKVPALGLPVILGLLLWFLLSGISITDIVSLYSLIYFILSFTAMVLFLLGKTSNISIRTKSGIVLLLLLCSILPLANFLPFRDHWIFQSIYILLFFLLPTALEALYLYRLRVDESMEIWSFDDFVSKYSITPRESEIVREIYNGMSNQEIADRLFVSLQTVKDHTSRIYLKAEVRSRAQLIALLRGYL